jgi:hypothetical protein
MSEHEPDDGPPIDRTLIDEARPALGPSDAQRARLKRAVVAAAVGSAAAGTAAVASGTGASATTAGAGLGAKIALVVFAVAAVGGGAWLAAREGAGAPQTTVDVAPVDAPPVGLPPPTAAVPEAEEAPPATTEPTVVPADAGPENEVRAEPPPDPRPGPRLAPDPTSIERESELLREAHAASQRGEPREALALLEQHARLFPRGALVTERRGLRILALCEAGEVDTARGEAQVFLRGRPPAGLAQRVQRSCAGNAAEGSEAP